MKFLNIVLFSFLSLFKKEQMTHLNPGDKAPDFKSVDQDEKPISLKQFEGKKIVLYFYPADDTPTCTTEACNIRDNYKALLDQGYVVLGVSPDSPAKHRKFIKKYKLPFSLIADEDLSITKAYGVWGLKKLFGNEYNGVLRTTFVIDEHGIITEVINKVKAKDHTNQILK